MSTSEQPGLVHLTVRAADPETRIYLIGSDFQLASEPGLGQLSKDLEPGLYKIKLRTGLETREETVALAPGAGPVTKDFTEMAFPSPAPLDNTSRSHEYHILAARTQSQVAHVTLGQGSSIFVFARDWTQPGTPSSGGSRPNPIQGLSLAAANADDTPASELVAYERAAVSDLTMDPWAACNVRVDPGAYRLRLTLPDASTLEQTLIAAPGWQTQVFLLQRDYRLPASASVVRRADPSNASILLARGEGFFESDREKRHAELARLGLMGRTTVVPEQVRDMVAGKFESPMLGVFAAYLLLAERARSDGDAVARVTDLLRIVLGNLRMLLGVHPDVEALALALGDRPRVDAFPVPPMLRRAWACLVEATVRNAALVPEGSLSWAIAPRAMRLDPWLVWRSGEAGQDLEAVVRTYMGQGLGERPPEALDLPVASFRAAPVAEDVAELAQPAAKKLSSEQLDALVRSLQLPRGQVEELVRDSGPPAGSAPPMREAMGIQTIPVAVTRLEALQPAVPDWPHAEIEKIPGPMTMHAFVSPDCSFEAMRDLLGRAKKTMWIYIYNVSSEDMLQLLRDAKARGVKIRIMYDTTDTREDEVGKLEKLGVDLKVAPSAVPRRAFTVCHQKFVVIDSNLVIVGSGNWATTSIPKPEGKPWKKGNREWFVAMESAAAAKLFTELFELDWAWKPKQKQMLEEEIAAALLPPMEEPLVGALVERAPALDAILAPKEFALAKGAIITPLFSPQNYFAEVKKAIASAKKSVWIQQQYIIKGKAEKGPVADLLAVLKQRQRDVPELDIRIVSSAKYPKGWDDTIATLTGYGLKSRLRSIDLSQFTHCHNKGVIVDGQTVVVSSTNWSDNSIAAAREAGIMIKNAQIAAYFAAAFDFDWRTGVRPSKLRSALSELAIPGVEPADEQVHPADLSVL